MTNATTTRPSLQAARASRTETSVNRWSAWASGCRWAACNQHPRIRGEVEAFRLDGQRRIVVSRCVGKTVEGQAVPARQAMVCRGWCRIMSMSDMRDRVDREGQQQRCESNSQPLRRSSGQIHQAHERQRTTVERRHRLRTTTATLKCGACYPLGFKFDASRGTRAPLS